MWDQVTVIFGRATGRVVENIANFLPGLVVLCVLILVALVIALVARVLVFRLLRGLDFDRWAIRSGFSILVDWSPERSPSRLVAQTVLWLILLLGFLAGLSALDAAMPSYFALTVFGYLPNVIGAIIILICGVLIARFLARSVLIGAVNLQMQSARLLSTGVKWLVLILTFAMALEQIGLGRDIVLIAFAILFGGVVLAMSLAIGLGSRDLVSRTLDRQMRGGVDRPEDTIDHV
ncbi:MAG TPA: hypothetical protein VIC33_03290 [Vicinamibacterales bacterium]|jgi:hypothetical protein